MANSVSVRFYFDVKKTSEEVRRELSSLSSDFGELNTESRYIEFKVEHHLFSHPYEFIPFDFQQKVRPFLIKITLVTTNSNNYGLKTGRDECGGSYHFDRSSRVPVQIGSSQISLDDDKVMIVGRNLEIMIKAYFLYCKYNGYMPDYQKLQTEQKVNELQQRYVKQFKENHNLILQIKIANAKIAELEQKITSKKKGWNYWLRKNF